MSGRLLLGRQDEEEETSSVLVVAKRDRLRDARERRHDSMEPRNLAVRYRRFVSHDGRAEPLAVEEEIHEVERPLDCAAPLKLVGDVDQDFLAGVGRNVEEDVVGPQEQV